ncbi:MAG: murein biosynthesis integral membrane protein MurJ [Microgenomates group bacterium]|jgi:putative peptidoglycan lipid II flippase
MVKNLLSLLSARQNSILSGAFVLMVTIGASKVLGLVRDRLLAHTFTPDQTAVYFAAFRLPDLLFQLFIFGAVSVAFIPVFTDYLHKKSEREAFEFAADILNVVLLLFAVVTVVFFIFAGPITALVVPGFTDMEKEMATGLTRVIIIGQLLLVVGAFFVGICQAYQRFIIPALAAASYTVGIIIGIVFLSPFFGIFGPALGVIIGALLHILTQLSLVMNLGFRYRFKLDIFNEGIKEVLRMMSIRTLGIAAEQLNETVGVVLASLISASSVTYLTFAQHLQAVPIGLFGATLAQAALPVLSRERTTGEDDSFKTTLLTTLHQIMFLSLPAAAMLVVLRIPAVRLVFGASQFDWASTVLTGTTLAWLAIGLTAQSMNLLLIRGFYALKDTRTPVIVSVLAVLVNVILSFVFVKVLYLDVWSLGLAYAISANASLLLLVYFLSNSIGGFNQKDLFIPAGKMLLAATISALVIYIPLKSLDSLIFDTTKTINLIVLSSIASFIGLSTYVFLVWLLKVKELETFGALLKRVYQMKWMVKAGPETIPNPPDTTTSL